MEKTDENTLENLWGDCMNEAALQNYTKEAHLVMLGDHN
jgi:hypothetical protein